MSKYIKFLIPYLIFLYLPVFLYLHRKYPGFFNSQNNIIKITATSMRIFTILFSAVVGFYSTILLAFTYSLICKELGLISMSYDESIEGVRLYLWLIGFIIILYIVFNILNKMKKKCEDDILLLRIYYSFLVGFCIPLIVGFIIFSIHVFGR